MAKTKENALIICMDKTENQALQSFFQTPGADYRLAENITKAEHLLSEEHWGQYLENLYMLSPLPSLKVAMRQSTQNRAAALYQVIQAIA